jgi:hypothetical protein
VTPSRRHRLPPSLEPSSYRRISRLLCLQTLSINPCGLSSSARQRIAPCRLRRLLICLQTLGVVAVAGVISTPSQSHNAVPSVCPLIHRQVEPLARCRQLNSRVPSWNSGAVGLPSLIPTSTPSSASAVCSVGDPSGTTSSPRVHHLYSPFRWSSVHLRQGQHSTCRLPGQQMTGAKMPAISLDGTSSWNTRDATVEGNACRRNPRSSVWYRLPEVLGAHSKSRLATSRTLDSGFNLYIAGNGSCDTLTCVLEETSIDSSWPPIKREPTCHSVAIWYNILS